MVMKKEYLVKELEHYKWLVKCLRSERNRLEVELSKVKDDLEKYKGCWEASCYTTDELNIPLENA